MGRIGETGGAPPGWRADQIPIQRALFEQSSLRSVRPVAADAEMEGSATSWRRANRLRRGALMEHIKAERVVR